MSEVSIINEIKAIETRRVKSKTNVLQKNVFKKGH